MSVDLLGVLNSRRRSKDWQTNFFPLLIEGSLLRIGIAKVHKGTLSRRVNNSQVTK
jgi:hypothetical protein